MQRPALLPVLLFALTGCLGCEWLGIGVEPAPPRESGPAPVRVSETFFTGETAYTPPASDAPLAFALSAGVRNSRPTVVVNGRYNLPAHFRARYGDDPRHGIFVVAINTEAHRVLVSPAAPVPEQPTGDPNAPAAEGGERLTGTFNVDLPVALDMPPLSAPFQVFVWADEIVTERESYIVPNNDNDRDGNEVMPITGSAILLEQTESDLAIPGVTLAVRPPPSPEDTEATTTATEGEDGEEEEPRRPEPDRGTVIEGVVAHNTSAPDPIPLLVLCVEKPSMRFGYARVSLPPDDDMPRFRWDMDVRNVFYDYEPTGRVWVLALMHTASAEPITLVPHEPVVQAE